MSTNPTPRTIDNLGVEVSTRYAEDKKVYDERLAREAGAVKAQTEIDVTSPSFPSEFETFLETRKSNIFWAEVTLPPRAKEQKRRVFTDQLIPSLGSADKRDTLTQRMNEMLAQAKQRKESAEEDVRSGRRTSANEERVEFEEEDREKNILQSMLERVSFFERVLIDINSRRSQYHKG